MAHRARLRLRPSRRAVEKLAKSFGSRARAETLGEFRYPKSSLEDALLCWSLLPLDSPLLGR